MKINQVRELHKLYDKHEPVWVATALWGDARCAVFICPCGEYVAHSEVWFKRNAAPEKPAIDTVMQNRYINPGWDIGFYSIVAAYKHTAKYFGALPIPKAPGVNRDDRIRLGRLARKVGIKITRRTKKGAGV